MNHEYNTMRIPVTAEMADDIRAAQSFHRTVETEMQRAVRDLMWHLDDDAANGHLGPPLGPGRNELRKVRERLRRAEYFRSLGRPAGAYRR